jgi:hypothetical protein
MRRRTNLKVKDSNHLIYTERAEGGYAFMKSASRLKLLSPPPPPFCFVLHRLQVNQIMIVHQIQG